MRTCGVLAVCLAGLLGAEGRTSRVNIYADGGDNGYLSGSAGRTSDINEATAKHNWWFDFDRPEAFSIFSLEGLYSAPYFMNDHVPAATTHAVVNGQFQAFRLLTGKQLKSIAEFGGAGGWFTAQYAAKGLDYQTVEGTVAGHRRIQSRPNVEAARVHRADLRMPLVLPKPDSNGRHDDGKFDMAMNTEVAEHIEVPFHSSLVATLTRASDLIWFSFAPPGGRAHVHHSAELPLRYWLNLFDFFGFAALKMHASDVTKFDNRGTLLLYNNATKAKKLPKLASLNLLRIPVEHSQADLRQLPQLLP